MVLVVVRGRNITTDNIQDRLSAGPHVICGRNITIDNLQGCFNSWSTQACSIFSSINCYYTLIAQVCYISQF